MAVEPRPLLVVPEWVEAHCVVPDGFRRGAPFRLYNYQLRWYSNFYLVRGDVEYDPDNPILGPAFVHRRGLLVAPQKVGKNPLIATQVCAEGVGPVLFAGWAGKDEGYACADHGCRCGWEYHYERGEPMGMLWPTPLIQITAVSEEATQNTYDALRPMIELGPLADLIPHTGEDFTRLPNGGRIDTVTSSALSRLGQRATFVAQDEAGLYTRENKMLKVADTQWRNLAGMGGRAALTSNAYDPSQHSVAQQIHESAAPDVYIQFDQPPKKLSYGNREERHRIHLHVYPVDTLRKSGGHLDIDSIENEAADLVTRDLAQASRFYGNMLVAGAGRAVNPEEYGALLRAPAFEEHIINGERLLLPPRGTRIGAGFDGSISNDSSALRGCTLDGYRFRIGRWDRPTGDALLAWQNEHPGRDWTVPRTEVHERVAWMYGYFSVGRMFYDPPKWWTEGQGWAAAYGDDIVLEFSTNVSRRFAPAVGRWLTDMEQGHYSHDGLASDHIEAAAIKAVRVGDDPQDQRTMNVLVKGEDRRKIDDAVADVLASEAAATMPEAQPVVPSVYEGRGIRTLEW